MKVHLQKKMVAIFFWAFASGIPLMLITATLSARLLQSGLPLVKIGMFSTALLPYALKFFGGPVVELSTIPVIGPYFGRTRSWMLLSMTSALLCLIWLSYLSVNNNLFIFYLATLATAFFSALSDIAEAELRIELLSSRELSIGNTWYVAGYGCGELLAGGGTLLLAHSFGWEYAYLITACIMIVGLIAIVLQPQTIHQSNGKKPHNSLVFNGIINVILLQPIQALLSNHACGKKFIIITIYYASSYLLTMMINPFYLQLGLSINQLGGMRTIIGFVALVFGGIIGGNLAHHYGPLRILWVCGLLYILNTCLQAILAQITLSNYIDIHSAIASWLFAGAISLTNFLDVISVISYITVIAELCHFPYTATQNAILTSAMALSRLLFSSAAGYLVTHLGWTRLFMMNIILIAPVLYLLYGLINKVANPITIKELSAGLKSQ